MYYEIVNAHESLNATTVQSLLKQSYWAEDRPIEVIEKSIKNSVCYAVISNNTLIGLGRIVTDHATILWICDIIVHKDYRGHGIGKAIMESINKDFESKNLLGILCTKDAHGLYEQYGFKLETQKAMIKRRSF